MSVLMTIYETPFDPYLDDAEKWAKIQEFFSNNKVDEDTKLYPYENVEEGLLRSVKELMEDKTYKNADA